MTKPKILYQFQERDTQLWLDSLKQQVNRINNPNGRPSRYNTVEIHIKGEGTDLHENDVFGSSYYRIPKGNLYLKCFYEGKPVNAINLYHDKDLKFNAKGKHPIFLFETDINEAENGDITVNLKTVGQFLRLAIWDRLEQIEYICRNGTKPAMWTLIQGTTASILKLKESNKSTTNNHQFRIANRICFLPARRKGDDLVNNGKWLFSPKHRYPKGEYPSVTDVFTRGKTTLEQLSAIFDKIELVLGWHSEASGAKNVYSENTPAIYEAKLKYSKPEELTVVDPKKIFADDPLSYINSDGDYITPYDSAQKAFARPKSANFANIAEFSNSNILVNKGGFEFNRSYCYAHKDPDKIGYQNLTNADTTFNILVAFVEGEKDFYEAFRDPNDEKDFDDYNKDEIEACVDAFNDLDKEMMSSQLDGADCHMKLSEEISDTLVKDNRSMTFRNPESSFTEQFHLILQSLKDNEEPLLVKADTDISIHTHLAYEVTCPECEELMSPAVDGKPVRVAKIGHQHWNCGSCGKDIELDLNPKFEETSEGKPFDSDNVHVVTFANKYNDIKSLVVENCDLDLLEDKGITLNVTLETPIGVSRIIAPNDTAAKAMSFPVSQSVLGDITIKFKHPETGEIIEYNNMPVDAVVPYGAFKGKNNGMSLAWTSFVNAACNTQYSPYQELIDGDIIGLTDKLNKVISEADIEYTRLKLVNGRLEVVTETEGVKFGLISIGVTENNADFHKLRKDSMAGKNSPTMFDFMNMMELDDLADSIRRCSVDTILQPAKRERFDHYMKAYKGVSEGYYECKMSDLEDPPTMPFTADQLKSEWQKIRQTHPLFTNPKYKDGVAIKCESNVGQMITFSIPPVELLLNDMVNQSHSSKVILDSTLLKILEIWSYGTKNSSTIDIAKIKGYRSSIEDTLRGKKGMIAKAMTAMTPMLQGKEISSGFIPDTTMVVCDDTYWRYQHKHHSEHFVLSFDEFVRRCSLPEEHGDAIVLFGLSCRHPNIWPFQNLNVKSIWHPGRADKYMKQKYGFGFYDYYPTVKSGKTKAIISNILDVLWQYASDSDGDMRFLTVVTDKYAQQEMAKIYQELKGYKIFKNDKYQNIKILADCTAWWHLKNVLSESQGNTADGYLTRKIGFDMLTVSRSDMNKSYLSAVKSKKSIGIVTVSSWFITEIGRTLVKQGQMTMKDFLSVVAFYTTCIVQDGCIRAVKHVAGAGLQNLVIDAMAENGIDNMIEDDNGKFHLPMEYMRILVNKAGYSDSTFKAFEKIVEYWRTHSAVKDNVIDSYSTTTEGLMIKASVSLKYGSQAGLLESNNVFDCINKDIVKIFPIYDSNQDVVELLNQHPDNLAAALDKKVVDKERLF